MMLCFICAWLAYGTLGDSSDRNGSNTVLKKPNFNLYQDSMRSFSSHYHQSNSWWDPNASKYDSLRVPEPKLWLHNDQPDLMTISMIQEHNISIQVPQLKPNTHWMQFYCNWDQAPLTYYFPRSDFLWWILHHNLGHFYGVIISKFLGSLATFWHNEQHITGQYSGRLDYRDSVPLGSYYSSSRH